MACPTADADSFAVGEGISSARASMYNVLRSLVRNNVEHFHTDSSNFAQRFHAAFVLLENHLNAIEPEVETIRRIAHHYDLDPDTPGNGYRSFISVVDCCVLQCIRLCRHVCLKRSSFLFRGTHYCAEVEAYAATMSSLGVGLHHLQTLHSWSQKGNLYPGEEHSPEELLVEAETVQMISFYGRCIGFQFCESMRKPLLALSLLMASFSEVYYNTGGTLARTASSLLNCGRYVLNPEERAHRVVDISQRASVDFCKAFWLLQETEVMQQLPSIVCPQVVVNKVFTIEPEKMEMPQYVGDGVVEIPIPTSHIGPTTMSARLLSSVHRNGQLEDPDDKKPPAYVPTLPQSPELIIHCHGGGFVAQSSKSHEVYLRDWARQLNVPIFCIDYSLAPLAPFPRALEDCFYLYAWALRNAHQLGTTGDKIVLVGDSAGGNLIMGIAMKAAEMGIRKPDGILAMYTPLLIQFIPSPSRLLCLMDPLLPFGFMMRCLKAYAGQTPLNSPKTEEKPQIPIVTITTPSESVVPEVTTPEHPEGGPSPPSKVETDETEKEKEEPPVEVKQQPPTPPSSPVEENKEHEINNQRPESLELEPDLVVSELTDEAERILNEFKSKDKFSRSDTMTTVSLTSEENSPVSPDKELNKDSDYVSEFIEKYGLMTDEVIGVPILEEGTDSEENVLFERTVDLSLGLSSKLSTVTSKVVSGISSFLSNSGSRSPTSEKAAAMKSGATTPDASVPPKMDPPRSLRPIADEFKQFRVSKDPYLSPYLASDEVLKELPPVTFMALQLDPCLDDSVMMCKRMRSLGKKADLVILDKLPHGFLNFSLISRDAYDGSKMCMAEVRKLLALEDDEEIEIINPITGATTPC